MPIIASFSTMRGTAAADSGLLTVTRTSSEPARQRSATCFTVEATSAVSVLVIDCTTTGASPPTATPPIRTWRVGRRGAGPKAQSDSGWTMAWRAAGSAFMRAILVGLDDTGGGAVAGVHGRLRSGSGFRPALLP